MDLYLEDLECMVLNIRDFKVYIGEDEEKTLITKEELWNAIHTGSIIRAELLEFDNETIYYILKEDCEMLIVSSND